MSDRSPLNRKDFEAYLIQKAWKDEGFAQQLRNNPKAAVEKELGTQLPDSIQIQVVEETPSTLYLVVPFQRQGAAAGTELSDSDLEQVAGGMWGNDSTYTGGTGAPDSCTMRCC